MKQKHTAGEWIVANSGGTVIAHNGTRYHRIALLENVPLSITPEIEANAKLIAAAPELLEALKVAHAMMFMDANYQGLQVLHTMQDAIKKATE